ncbi:uncharacterized protein V1513DRAFT_441990 [Lipomyces chichibuensis]|uniref:uncharacterized protein n=1 Tax=Lipomyces chichibuensis TaxID=1546026 RepID=UPI003343A654
MPSRLDALICWILEFLRIPRMASGELIHGRIGTMRQYACDSIHWWLGKIDWLFLGGETAGMNGSAIGHAEQGTEEREYERHQDGAQEQQVDVPQSPGGFHAQSPLSDQSTTYGPPRLIEPIPQPTFVKEEPAKSPTSVPNLQYGAYLPTTVSRPMSSRSQAAAERKKKLAEQLRRRRKSELRYGPARFAMNGLASQQPTYTGQINGGPATPFSFTTSTSISTSTSQQSEASAVINLSSIHPYRSSNRIAKYRSPFKSVVTNGERFRKNVSAYGLESIRNNARLSAIRNRLASEMNGFPRSPFVESLSPAVPTLQVRRRALPSHMSDSQSVDELLRQLIKEGNASDFPSWKAIQERRKERAKAIEELRRGPRVEHLAPLTGSQLKTVEECFRIRDTSRVLVAAFRIDITVRDIRTLANRQWLNDNVIDFYLEMVTQRSRDDPKLPKSFCFSTHFFTTLSGNRGYQGVARWGKRKQLMLSNTDYIFVPINVHNAHWCVSVINIKRRRFEYYDSLGGGPGNCFTHLRDYIINECRTQSVPMDDIDGWDEYVARDSPMQENGFDCGVFTCKTAEVLSRECPLSFSQKDMQTLRRRMVFEILVKRLLT